RVRRGARKEPAEAALLGDPHDLASEAAIRPRDSRKDSRIVRLRIEYAGPLALTSQENDARGGAGQDRVCETQREVTDSIAVDVIDRRRVDREIRSRRADRDRSSVVDVLLGARLFVPRLAPKHEVSEGSRAEKDEIAIAIPVHASSVAKTNARMLE